MSQPSLNRWTFSTTLIVCKLLKWYSLVVHDVTYINASASRTIASRPGRTPEYGGGAAVQTALEMGGRQALAAPLSAPALGESHSAAFGRAILWRPRRDARPAAASGASQ